MKNETKNPDKTKVTVPCPVRLQRQMLQNLQKAALNRFNKIRAKKALELLSTINAESNVVYSQAMDSASAAEISPVTDMTTQNLVAK